MFNLLLLSTLGAVVITCSAATSMPSPSCMLNNESCPIPRGWVADWSVINSTAMLSAAESPNGFYPVNHWGYVTLDWQVGYNVWLNADPQKSTCEATNAANCVAIKKSGKVKRCGIYHNMELALEWLQSNRLVMDQTHVDLGWFLKYTNGSVFNHQIHAHAELGPLLNQWFIDWRNADAAAYFAEAILNATFLPGVDATFTDDLPGVPAEHPEVQPATNMSDSELAKLQFATQMGENYVATSLAIAGKFCWDCIGGEDGPEGSSYSMNQVPPPNTPTGCAQWFRHYCAPAMQGRGMFMDWACTGGNCTDPKGDRRNQTLAAFLITRGPYAFIGSRSLRDHNWHPLFATDVGEPLGLCSESGKNVFSRVWSKGVATLDCNTYTADLPFKPLEFEQFD